MAGIASAKAGASVRILEKNDRVGRKILATGNGRCNFTNLSSFGQDYFGGSPDFIAEVLALFDPWKTLSFFEELGILPRIESEGRVYPYSEQAVSVLDALTSEITRLGVEIIVNSTVTMVEKTEKGFIVLISGGRQYRSDSVIVAVGGRAGAQFGCTGDGYSIARRMGHQVIEPKPGLVQLIARAEYFNNLKGIRAKGQVALYKSNLSIFSEAQHKPVAVETGEIQFTETGLSGICLFNLSRHVQEASEAGKNRGKQPKSTASLHETAYIVIDLVPDISLIALTDKLNERLTHCRHKDLPDFLNGIINKKLIPVLLAECKLPERHKTCETLDQAAINRIAAVLKGWPIEILGSKGFQDAQTTAGGVDTSEVDAATLESKLIKNLYFTGEVLDVDGRCGGYNLQWAWTTGFLAGCAAGREKQVDPC
jgi:hypothetical protein